MHIRASGGRPGQTLVEVVIAVLILAITTVSVFSVLFSNSVPQQKADKKEQAALLIRSAQQTLKAYVTAAPNDARFSPSAGGRWSADASGAWALAPGLHDISSLMNGTVLQARTANNLPVNCVYSDRNCTECCYLIYEVADNGPDCNGGAFGPCKTVVFSMRY